MKKKNNHLDNNATKSINHFRMLTAGIFFFLSCSSAWAVTEKEILAADPKKMLRGIVQACNDNNEKKLYSYFTENAHGIFIRWTADKKTKMFHVYCKQFKEDFLPKFGPLDKAIVYVKKTNRMGNGEPIFKMCLAQLNDTKTCSGDGGLTVYLESGSVKINEH